MSRARSTIVVMRRAVLQAASWGALGLAGSGVAARPSCGAPEVTRVPDTKPPYTEIPDDTHVKDSELIERLTGRTATESPRVHLDMPPVFGNGYSVPMTLAVDSPMTETDHVREVHVLAPRNPILVVANFQFTPRSGRVAISTRVRLAQPQNVLAVAEMSDGALLMARTWVKVETNGCT